MYVRDSLVKSRINDDLAVLHPNSSVSSWRFLPFSFLFLVLRLFGRENDNLCPTRFILWVWTFIHLKDDRFTKWRLYWCVSSFPTSSDYSIIVYIWKEWVDLRMLSLILSKTILDRIRLVTARLIYLVLHLAHRYPKYATACRKRPWRLSCVVNDWKVTKRSHLYLLGSYRCEKIL